MLMKNRWIAAVAISLMSLPASAALTAGEARSLFDRLKQLEGSWKGKSTKGWEATKSIRVIASGSVVMATSFDAHPGEAMATMYHLDGDRLLLTHYCVAKNQPRLIATSYDSTEHTATFEYLDATGISSRDQGHMDKLILRFKDAGSYHARWTWYAKGSERWLEDIEYIRVAGHAEK